MTSSKVVGIFFSFSERGISGGGTTTGTNTSPLPSIRYLFSEENLDGFLHYLGFTHKDLFGNPISGGG